MQNLKNATAQLINTAFNHEIEEADIYRLLNGCFNYIAFDEDCAASYAALSGKDRLDITPREIAEHGVEFIANDEYNTHDTIIAAINSGKLSNIDIIKLGKIAYEILEKA